MSIKTEVLSFNETLDLIRHVGPYRTIIVQGENGVGKTALERALAQLPEFADFHKPGPIDCTQLSDGSIWMPEIDTELGVSRELPNERMGLTRKNQRGVAGSRPVLLCFDEVLKTPQFVKNMIAPIVYERRVGSYYAEMGSIIFGCTNLSVEGLGDTIQPHLRSRLIFVTMRKPTMEEWKDNFAIPNGLHESVIAYVHQHPQVFDSFLDYEPGGKYSGKPLEKDNGRIFNPRVVQDGFASPRTLHAVSDVVRQMDKLTPVALQCAVDGTVGKVTGRELASFVRFARDLTPFERVVADPKKAPISDNPTAQLVQVFQFITRTKDRGEASAVVEYVQRMRNELQTLFVTDVANSTKITTFANVPRFAAMLKDNRIYLGGK